MDEVSLNARLGIPFRIAFALLNSILNPTKTYTSALLRYPWSPLKNAIFVRVGATVRHMPLNMMSMMSRYGVVDRRRRF